MTLLQCSEKLFRPWDSDHPASHPPASPRDHIKLEPELSSVDILKKQASEYHPLLPAALAQQLHSAGSLYHHQLGQIANAHLHSWFPVVASGIPATEAHPHRETSFTEFLASIESAPEALHAGKLAALGVGPTELGELYNLAGIRQNAVLPSTGTSSSSKKQRPKRFRCPHCNVAFSNNGQLKGHIRSHTGERPFKCDVESCNKTFTRNEELTRHKRIHSGVRPFPCGVCGKKFGRRDHLKKHTRTHQRPTNHQLGMVPFPYVPYLPSPPSNNMGQQSVLFG